MTNFNFISNFGKPGDILTVQGSCVGVLSSFSSSDENIAYFSSPLTLSVIGIGEVIIKETSLTPLCSNNSGLLFTSTEDGKPFLMSLKDYNTFTNYEGIFFFFLLLTAFLINFAKKS